MGRRLASLQCLSVRVQRLTGEKREHYLKLLSKPEKHPDYLGELIPASTIGPDTPMEFEVAGLGGKATAP